VQSVGQAQSGGQKAPSESLRDALTGTASPAALAAGYSPSGSGHNGGAALEDVVSNLEPLISEKEAARRLNISVDLLIQRRFRGQPLIPYVRIGRSIRYDPGDVRAFIAANRHGALAEGRL